MHMIRVGLWTPIVERYKWKEELVSTITLSSNDAAALLLTFYDWDYILDLQGSDCLSFTQKLSALEEVLEPKITYNQCSF